MIGELRAKVEELSFVPTLAIIQVGEREDSSAYIKQKQKFGEETGVQVLLKQWKDGKKERLEEEITQEIEKLNRDKKINGIIVQLPLPESLDTEKIINAISEKKDADGLRQSDTEEKELSVTPATARAVMSLLDFYEIDVRGKKAAVIGKSRLAGGPIAEELERRGAKVKICHKGTEDNTETCAAAELLVVAAGSIGLVTKEFVNERQVVVDVGINRVWVEGKPKLIGDVAFAEVEPVVAAISPVPGGVGPLTVACLFENLLDLIGMS